MRASLSQSAGIFPRGASRLVLVLLTAIACWWPVAAFSQNAPEDYRFAVGLYKQQRWDVAADAFRDFIKKNPDDERIPYARLYLGLTLVNADRYVDARRALRDYVRDYPQSKTLSDALYRIAECSYLLDDLQPADAEFEAFLKRYPRNELAEWALPYLGDTKLRLKKPDAARDVFQRALEQFPRGRMADDARFGLAEAYEDLKQPTKAVALYRELAAKKQSPRAPQSLMNLATIQFHAREFDEAVASFRRLTEEFPKSPLVASAHLNAGYSLYQKAQFQQAIDEFDRAAADKAQSSTARYWKGISLKAIGNFPEAIQALKAAYEANPKSELAEGALFYWADCELRAGHYAAAKPIFLDVVAKWPKGDYADDSVHFAAEAALLAGSLEDAEQLVRRFENEFPNSPLRLHKDILAGRILSARANARAKQADANNPQNRQLIQRDREAAIRNFDKALTESRLPATIALARYHLGRTLEDAGDNSRAVDVFKPLAEQADRTDAPAEAADSLVPYARGLQDLHKPDAAIGAYTKYLALRPKGSQVEQALAGRALCHAALGQKEPASADFELLAKQSPRGALTLETLGKLAEIAYDAKDWPTASQRFSRMAEAAAKDSDAKRAALAGLGWTKFQSKAYDEAAAAFAQVFDGFSPRNSQVAEAGYMRARSLQEAHQLAEAARAYASAFEKLAPTAAAEPGSELRPPGQYPYLSGVQAADLLVQLKRTDEADAAYRRVVERYPKAQKLDQVLFAWANLLHNKKDAESQRRVRALLMRIVGEFPEGSTNDNARLFLAELDLADGKGPDAAKSFRALLADSKTDRKVREDSLARLVGLAVDKEDWPSVRGDAKKFLDEFPRSPDARLVRLHLASAELGLKDPAAAVKTLSTLKQDVLGESQPLPEWMGRIWILLAEGQYQQKAYEDVERTVDELRKRLPKSPFLYQADEILGRSFKNQAQWSNAVAAFQRVIDDRRGEQNETAAKSQFMIGDIFMLQKEFESARTAYLKVYTLYEKLPDWGAPALFEVGQCEEALKRTREAEKTYNELVNTFPNTEFAKKAKKQLDELRKRVSSQAAGS